MGKVNYMIYYKITVLLPEYKPEEESSPQEKRTAARAIAQRIRLLTNVYNEKNTDRKIFLASLLESKCYLGAVSQKGINKRQILSYLHEIDQSYTDINFSETTFHDLLSLLHTSLQNRFLEDEDEFLEKLELDQLNTRRLMFDEFVLTGNKSKTSLIKDAQKLLSSSLKEEIQRIFACQTGSAFIGHPVHYLMETDSFETSQKLFESLLSALYRANRLQNRRYTVVDFSEQKNRYYEPISYDQLGKSCEGGAIVIQYSGKDSEDEEFADKNMDNLICCIQKLKPFQNNTLFVICLPKACNKIKDMLFAVTENTTFVEIQEDFVFGNRAKEYLKEKAKEKKITADESLYKEVTDSDKGFSSSDLDKIWEDWMHIMLKTKIYPQYAELKSAKRQIAEEKPQGSAYDELQKMIGLENAKNMITRALNYYKAQKLFKDKGMSSVHPAMHMVFTGNPGTAKTTVARLFARIMKENGLLSEGKLYETGRADLVGKYVGWTAQIVKDTFKKAKGSVLFIDEAYSLLDDRIGMFGDEAINTIVQEMENNREDIVVIFAGYPNEMEQFLLRNPGLRSRITFHIPFEDYSAEELYDITSLLAEKSGMTLSSGVKEKLLPAFRLAAQEPDFGNGRFARNILEQAKMSQAERLVTMNPDQVTRDDVTTLLPDDFEVPKPKKVPIFQIGFAV